MRYINLRLTFTLLYLLLLITWITTHLPTHEGWMAELAMLADR